MASGDEVFRTAGFKTVKLLDAVATGATSSGPWVDCADYQLGTVVITGAATTTIADVEALNDGPQPLTATAGAVVGASAAGATAFISMAALPRWLKSTITVTGTGTVTAILVARKGF